MKNFNIRKGNYLKDPNSTSNMMYTVLIVLVPFIIFSVFKNGIYPAVQGYGNLYTVFKPLIYIILPAVITILVEYLFYLIKGDKKSISVLFGEHYAIMPGIFLGLVISINTPIWLLVLGAIIASLSKLLFGGFGKNKLNPALVGGLFVLFVPLILSFLLEIYQNLYRIDAISSANPLFNMTATNYLNPYEADVISSATPLSNMTATNYLVTYENLVAPFGTLLTLFFGNMPGALGETSSLLCLVALAYLIYKKVVKWRIPVTYLLTVVVISSIICIIKDIGLWFVLFNLLSGGLLFGATFMATDPVTSPIGKRGQVIGGIFLGISTMVIRYITKLPEGVLISILLFNVLTIFINKLTVKLYTKNKVKNILVVISCIICLISPFVISKNIITEEPDNTYKIMSKSMQGNSTIYEVSGIGYAGNNSIKLKITFTGNDITNIEVLSSHETYMGMIYDEDYLNKIITNQDNLDNLDTISGCTYTSKYLKEIVEKTKEDYNK